MFDEIFKKWINTGELQENDIVPLMLEWNQTFGNKKATVQEAVASINFIPYELRFSLLQFILKNVGIKKGYDWCELYDSNGNFLARYWNKSRENETTT